jgi:hypothetical protein
MSRRIVSYSLLLEGYAPEAEMGGRVFTPLDPIDPSLIGSIRLRNLYEESTSELRNDLKYILGELSMMPARGNIHSRQPGRDATDARYLAHLIQLQRWGLVLNVPRHECAHLNPFLLRGQE